MARKQKRNDDYTIKFACRYRECGKPIAVGLTKFQKNREFICILGKHRCLLTDDEHSEILAEHSPLIDKWLRG